MNRMSTWGLARPGLAALLMLGACGGEPTSNELTAEQPIVGGANADNGEYPFMVRLLISGPGGSFGCGGSLVAPSFVMTAAHCITNTSRTGISQPQDLTVIINRRDLSTAGGETHAVSEVIRHPDYNTQTGELDHDVAILRLPGRSAVAPVDLASPYAPSARALWRAGVSATIIGYGRTSEGGAGSTILQEAVVPIMEDIDGEDAYGSSFQPSIHLAAGFDAGGIDSCSGDSGGPLLVSSNAGWKQAGIVSWGSGCARAGRPGVYTRIGGLRLHRWIKTVIHETPAVGDVNGDGREDIITFTHGTRADVIVALSNGASFGAASQWGDWWAHNGHIPLVGDFNGDGLDDIWAFAEDYVWVGFSNGTSFSGGLYDTSVSLDLDGIPMLGDVNGDGKDDLIIFSADANADVHVRLSTGTSLGASTRWHDYFCLEGETPAVGDANGDGRADIIVFSQGVNGRGVYVALSNGTSAFGTSARWHSSFGLAGEAPAVGRFDGDSRADIVTFTRNALADVYVGVSNGTSSFTSSRWQDNFGDARSTLLVGDVNGDGRDDAVRFTQDAEADVFVALSTGSAFGTPSRWHAYFAP